METKRNPIDILLDPNDSSVITLYDSNDQAIDFEQICIVPIKKQIYCVLKPIKPMEGLASDEALVFQIYTDEIREDSLVMITDEDVLNEVFEKYNELLKEAK